MPATAARSTTGIHHQPVPAPSGACVSITPVVGAEAADSDGSVTVFVDTVVSVFCPVVVGALVTDGDDPVGEATLPVVGALVTGGAGLVGGTVGGAVACLTDRSAAASLSRCCGVISAACRSLN